MNMGDYAKFSATLAKVTVNGKKAQVLLEMQHKDLEKHYLTLVSSIDDQIIVQFGNPQTSMEDFGVKVEGQNAGAKVTVIDGNIEKVEPAAGEQDELTWDVDGQEPEEVTDEASDGEESDAEGEDEQTEGEGSDDPQEEPQDGADELSGAKNYRDELDAFILERKPHFEDLPYDFPSILQRKRNGEEWLQISASLGMTKGQLETKFRAYKKRVKDLLA